MYFRAQDMRLGVHRVGADIQNQWLVLGRLQSLSQLVGGDELRARDGVVGGNGGFAEAPWKLSTMGLAIEQNGFLGGGKDRDCDCY